MKTQLSTITIICIMILICSSCSITRQTTCPTFANKTEKVHKPLFSKKKSSKKEKQQLSKITDQTKKEKNKHSNLARIESIISKIEMNDLIASSDNEITLHSTDIAPTFAESKLQKFLYKRIEKKSEKILKNLENHDQKRNVKKSCEQIISKKKHKKKRKKIFSNKDDDPADEREVHDFAIMSLLAGITMFIMPFLIPLIGAWFLIPTILLAIFAINWGIVGRKLIKENPSKYKGQGMALTGLILGLIAAGVVVAIVVLIIIALLVYSLNH